MAAPTLTPATTLDEVIDRIDTIIGWAITEVLSNNEVCVINEAITQFRDDAWRFARILSFEPGFVRPVTIGIRDFTVAKQGGLIYHPPSLVGVTQAAVEAVAARESRDVQHNIAVLNEIAAIPAPISTSL